MVRFAGDAVLSPHVKEMTALSNSKFPGIAPIYMVFAVMVQPFCHVPDLKIANVISLMSEAQLHMQYN